MRGLVYLDTSVALAQLLAVDVHPPAKLWDEALVSSRLLEYELLGRVNARGLGPTHGDLARTLLAGVSMLELVAPVVQRAAEAFPVGVRTLDAIHLASLVFLSAQGQSVRLASYDGRICGAAEGLGIPLYPL